MCENRNQAEEKVGRNRKWEERYMSEGRLWNREKVSDDE